MCFRCEGKPRKPITSSEELAIYLREPRGEAWKEVEQQEISACTKSTLRADKQIARRREEAPKADRPIM